MFIPAAVFEATFGYFAVDFFNFCYVAAAAISFLLNRFGSYKAAKIFIIISLDLILFGANFFEGLQTGNYLVYIAVALLFPILVKIKDEVRETIGLFLFTTACVFASMFFCTNTGYLNIITLPNAHILYYVSFSIAFFLAGLLVFIIYDITNKREIELIEAKNSADENSNAKMLFLSNMSHELRTPLNGILGATNLLMDETVSTSQREKLDMLHFSASHMLNVVNDILNYSKIAAGQVTLQPVNFNLLNFLRTVFNSFSYQFAEKEVDYKLEVEGFLPEMCVFADEVRLGQILNNLLANALKFTNKGEVILRAKASKKQEHVVVLFEVIDTGVGIKAEYLNKIFESFAQADYKTNKKYGGTGLGLSISKQLALQFNSIIQVQTEYKAGSTFSFEVNLSLGNLDIEKTVVYEMVTDFKQKRVLLAEDNPVNMIIANRFLQNWNILVTRATDGVEALEAFNKGSFDAVLLDLGMPNMDGYETVLRIREQNAKIPVIAFTAAILDKELLSKGFTDFVFKPFQPAAFNQILAKYLNALDF